MEKGRRVAGRGGGGGEKGWMKATFDLHPGEPDCLKGLLLADVYLYGGFPNFFFGLGSYREDVNFLRIIMDEAQKRGRGGERTRERGSGGERTRRREREMERERGEGERERRGEEEASGKGDGERERMGMRER